MYSDVVIIDDKYFEKRGNIYTIYDKRKTPNDISFVQDKISKSFQGVIRGFHGDDKTWKLISCLSGVVKLITYNIDTDIKKTYLLDSDRVNNISVLVPPRTLNAHQCLSNNCIFYYKWSEFYTGASSQWSVKYDDPTICAKWDSGFYPIVSERDINSPTLEELKNNVKSY